MPRVQVPEYKTFVDFPDDMAPEQMQAVLAQNFPKKRGIVDGLKGAGANAARVVNEANAGFLDKLADIARRIPHDPTDDNALDAKLRRGAKAARFGAEYWAGKARDAGMAPESLPGKIYGGIGGAPMGIAEFTAGVPYAVATAGSDPVKAAKAGLERFAVGKVFKGLEKANLTPVQRSGAMAGTMAAQTAAEGGGVQDVVASGLTGLALSAPAETGARSVVRQRVQAAGTSPEIAVDLAGRSGGVEPQGPGYITHERDPRLWSGEPVRTPQSETVPPATDATVVRPSEQPFNHDSLPTAAVTAADSLQLQQVAPEVKVAVVGTPAEIAALRDAGQTKGKVVYPAGDRAYVIDPTEAKRQFGSLDEAKRMLRAGGDAEAQVLGYPARGGVEQPVTAAVTKQGEVLTDPATVRQAATDGRVAYAAEGAPESVAAAAGRVADAVRGGEASERKTDANAEAQGRRQEEGLLATGGSASPAPTVSREHQAKNKVYESLLKKGTPVAPNRVELTDKQVTPAIRQKLYRNLRPEETNDFILRPKSDVTGNPHDSGWVLRDKRPDNAARQSEPPTGQVDLHAGVHIPTLVKQVYDHYFRKLDPTAAPGSVKDWQNKNEEANRKHGKEPVLNSIRRATVDQSANAQNELVHLGPEGRWAKDELNAVSGATGISSLRRERARDNILKGASLRERQAFERLVPIDRDLAIADYKAPDTYTYTGGFTPAELQAARKSFQVDYKLTDKEFQRAEQAATRYFEAYKENSQRMLDAGLITPEQKVELDSHPYSPKQFLEKIDPTGYGQSGPYSVPESGIPRLKQGSDGYYRNDPMRLLEESIDRVETRIARNNANKALAALPAGNGIVEPAKRIGKDTWSKPPAGFEQISYMEKGQRQVLNIREDFAREWRQNDPLVGSLLVDTAGWLSGATPLRAAATGHNPAFMVVNLPVDLMLQWYQAHPQGYSRIAPVAAAQMARNLIKVAPDAWKHVGRYEDWVMQYGGREMLSQYGSLTSRRKYLSPVMQKVSDVTSKMGRFSEEVSRLAYREQLIKNGVDPHVASRVAAEIIDYNRGGTVIKALDRLGLPYLNAGIQGFRSMARSAGRDPAMFALKSAQLLVGASILYSYNHIMNPEGWANVSDKDKAEYFIVMAPSYFNHVGSDGGIVYPFLKIRKEQFIRPILSAAEVAWQYATEGKDASQQLKFALDGANPLSLSKFYPPTAKAALAYFYNTDLFREQPVWKGKQDIEPYAEYTLNTNPVLTAIGKATAYTGEDGQLKGGVSPERLSTALGSVVTPSNFFAQIGGNALTDLYEQMNPTDKTAFAKTAYEKWKTAPGLSRLLGLARDTEQFREGIREARTGTATQQFETNKTLDAMVLRYIRGGQQDAALYQRIADYVAQQPPGVQDRLNGRIDDLAETANLPDRGWWMAVKALQPEDRADQFKARLQKASPEEQHRMLQIADRLTGFISDRFIDRYNQQ